MVPTFPGTGAAVKSIIEQGENDATLLSHHFRETNCALRPKYHNVA
jgi:hypothetical protein